MPTQLKKWIILELVRRTPEGGRPKACLEVDANCELTTIGEWVTYYRRMDFANVLPEHQKERGLKTPKVEGKPVPILGPVPGQMDMLGYVEGERFLRMTEVVGWEEASQEFAEACDKGYEVERKTFKSMCSPLVTATVHSIRDLGGPGANGTPQLRMPQ